MDKLMFFHEALGLVDTIKERKAILFPADRKMIAVSQAALRAVRDAKSFSV
jgi:hypothetical protein